MKDLYPRIICSDGVSLSVQASQYAYCSPRIDSLPLWQDYSLVEVGFIKDSANEPLSPPDTWREYSDGSFPSDVYGYIPVEMVLSFIEEHGGKAEASNTEEDAS